MSTLTDWVRKSGVLLPPVLAWDDVPVSHLSPFDAALEGAQAVFLGEMDHFVHEKTDFRLLLLRWLQSRGVTRWAEELSGADGVRVNRYLHGEDEQLFRLVGLGYEGDLRTDRIDRPTGILKASFDAYPVALFAAEQRRFYRGLRALPPPDRFAGFDVDALPGAAYANIRDAIGELATEPTVAAWLESLARVPGETVAEEAARVRQCLHAVKDIIPAFRSAARVGEVALALATHAQTLDYIDATYGQGDYAALSAGLAQRETFMKDLALDAIQHGGRIVPTAFMAHALHLLKDDALVGAAGPAGPGGLRVPTLGHYLAKDCAFPAFSVWMIWAEGEDSQPFPDLPRRFSYPKDSLNAALAPIGRPVMFPVAGAPPGLFDRPWRVGHMYNQTVDVTLAGQVDAILFLPRVSPLRPD